MGGDVVFSRGRVWLFSFAAFVVFPTTFPIVAELAFLWAVGGGPKPCALQGIGQILLAGEVARKIVGIAIAIVVAQVFHQLGWRIA